MEKGQAESEAPDLRQSVHVVCRTEELPPDERKIVEIGGRAIGVLNVGGEYFAVRNTCPHQGGPLCRGSVGGTMLPSAPQEWIFGLEDRVIRCPWHGWEFELESGRSLFDPERARVRVYPVTVEAGKVMLHA